MRATLGAVVVDVYARFAGDLLGVTELGLGRPDATFQVGLSNTADLPLPMAPFPLLRVVDDHLELHLAETMTAHAGDCPIGDGDRVDPGQRVTVRWREVEVDIVPAAAACSRRLAPRRAWPLELLSSAAVSAVALSALFPAALLMMTYDDSSHDERARTLPAHIVFSYRSPSGEGVSAVAREPRVTRRIDREDATVHGETSRKVAVDRRAIGDRARDAASRSGVLGLLKGQTVLDGAGSYVMSDDAFWTKGTSSGGLQGGFGFTGSGGGGAGGTIGLGRLGTIGRGGNMTAETIPRRILVGVGHADEQEHGDLGGAPRPRAPDVVPGSVQVIGSIDKEALRRVIHVHLNEVRFCYERALIHTPALSGRLVIAFLIDGDGSVSLAASSRESTLRDINVGACTAEAFRRWEFPRARGGGKIFVHYPFDFIPART
jgi:hypothetical protein